MGRAGRKDSEVWGQHPLTAGEPSRTPKEVSKGWELGRYRGHTVSCIPECRGLQRNPLSQAGEGRAHWHRGCVVPRARGPSWQWCHEPSLTMWVFCFGQKRKAGAPCKVRWGTLAPRTICNRWRAGGPGLWVQPPCRARVYGLSRSAYPSGLGHGGHPPPSAPGRRAVGCGRVPCTRDGCFIVSAASAGGRGRSGTKRVASVTEARPHENLHLGFARGQTLLGRDGQYRVTGRASSVGARRPRSRHHRGLPQAAVHLSVCP